MSKSTPSAIPGVSMMTDTLDFFKNMWENVPGMNLPGMKHIPGMVMPTLSVDEIEKQIKDLKAVESWLALNLNMLQGTIQALEVQKATISTLQTMGETFTAAMQPPSTDAHAEKPAFQSPFSAASAAAEKSAATEKAAAERAADAAAAREKSAAREKRVAEAAEAVGKSPVQPALDATAAMADAMQPLANPAAWWGMLQDQFKQAVDTAAAMTPDATMPRAEPASGAAKSSAKSGAPEKAEATSTPRKRKPAPKA
ncbi:PhaM family polyhydroxyalkanoate granule multifunctional regulatory protein [Janthinobacterium sp. 17J80-10]|uniref:PhaM family polyhydroxyalkanoate granule multifunctional regulatory protein n=1 Tax=Janthinobacterium sp. 17J80-10 TaxID=2497863 RepID=UPI0010056FF8|nr:PhaM family polyhydroxyalkanoate granule multifunctional regulatory protein [Janthinobacterium sp. 17J80-10]QAU33317.1 hypothetical protein EKL02_03480 [Janthinobacterium sp. 17J80-10]